MRALNGCEKHIRAFCGDALNLLGQRLCCNCQRPSPDDVLCPQCLIELAAMIAKPYCPRCGSGLGENILPSESGCSQCPATACHYEHIVRLSAFEGPMAAVITQLKFANRSNCAATIAKFLAQVVASTTFRLRPDIVCPVPLHWLRRLKRGYNQSQLIASGVTGQLDLPLTGQLIRTRNTPSQMGLSRRRRLQNIKGAFAVKDPAALDGRCVLLIDDVSTTGATASEAAKTLLKAGCSHVILAVAAKAEPPAIKSKYSSGTPT